MYEVIAIVAFVMGIVVLLSVIALIMRAFWGKSPDAVMRAQPAAETMQAGPIGAAIPAAPGATTRASTRAARTSAPIWLCVAIILGGILGGGLIWLGLHFGFEFQERLLADKPVSQPVQDKLPVALLGVPRQSLACNTVEARYGLIIDAGSSGSRIYIYCWKPAGANGIPWVTAAPGQAGEPSWTMKDDKMPLSNIDVSKDDVSKDKDAEKSLKLLTDYAIEKIGNDPQTLAQTPLHLMATAGMRLKTREERDEIIETVKKYLKRTFSASSRVISGKEEALYGWIAVNYSMGLLKEKDGNSSPTMGTLELGGASTQIAYASSNPPPQGRLSTLQWGETTYKIYLHSGDAGQDQALDKINTVYKEENGRKTEKENPCYPINYQPEDKAIGKGSGKYKECKEKIERNLEKIIGTLPPATQHPRGAFLAYAGYYYTYSILKIEPFFSLTKLEQAGKDYCEKDWGQIEQEYKKQNKKYLTQYCFTAAYIATLLQIAYRFPEDTQQIIFTDTLHGNDVSWTLGAMIHNLVPSSPPE
jgi:apyrase